MASRANITDAVKHFCRILNVEMSGHNVFHTYVFHRGTYSVMTMTHQSIMPWDCTPTDHLL